MTGEVQACGCFVNRHPDTLAHMHTPSRPAPLSLSWTGQWGRWLAAVPVPWNPAACAHMQKCVSICGRGGWPLSQRVYRASQIHSPWFDGQRVCHLRLIIFGKVTWICDIKYTNISLFPRFLPPLQPSHSHPLIEFPGVLGSLCCCVITAHTPERFVFLISFSLCFCRPPRFSLST